MKTAIESGEYKYIKQQIRRLTQVDLDCYKVEQVQRRLKTYLVRSGHESWVTFFREMRGDPEGLKKLRDYLTINVSSFFRDPDKYKYLGRKILPELVSRWGRLRVWSAGCSRGQEAYTLAMMLEDQALGLSGYEVLGTDLDRSALAAARSGGPYNEDDVANVRYGYLRRFFDRNEEGYWANEDLRRKVTFREGNLLSSSFGQGYDLIVCRNVVIYFTAEVKARLYGRFYNALRPGGVLFVGGTETIPHWRALGYESAGVSFYRRSPNGAH